MELSLVSHDQLIEIFHAVRKEIRRRKSDRETRNKIKQSLRSFNEEHPESSYKKLEKTGDFYKFPENTMATPPQRRLPYLPHLLQQDWSHLFPNRDEKKLYYVYAHCDVENGYITLPSKIGGTVPMPFYIGKGAGNRAYDLSRNQGHGIKLRDILRSGAKKSDIVLILRGNLTEAESLALESKLIYFFGTIYEKDRNGILLNLDIPLRPNFQKVLKSRRELKRGAV